MSAVCCRASAVRTLLVCLLGPLASAPASALRAPVWPGALARARRAAAAVTACAAPPSGFAALGVREEVVEALAAEGATAPTEVQRRAIPMLAGGADVVLGAQTGTGKTFAYLVPIMQSLKAAEEAADGARSRPRRPRAIVLLPTRELALQVRGVAKAIGHRLKLSVGAVHGGVPEGPQRRLLDSPLDVLVATPGRLVQASLEPAESARRHTSKSPRY